MSGMEGSLRSQSHAEGCTTMNSGSRQVGLVGVERAAKFLGIQVSTMYAWCEQRRIPHIRIGRVLRFDLKDLNRWVSEHRVESQ